MSGKPKGLRNPPVTWEGKAVSTKINLEYCGMEGNGRTVGEAKKDAAAKLSRLVADLSHAPEIVTCGDYVALVHRDAHGWHSALISGPDGIRAGAVYGTSYGPCRRAEAVQGARYHVAQLTWHAGHANDMAYARACGLDERNAAELVSWAAWQRRYQAAVAAGATGDEAHEIASDYRRAMPVAA